MHDSGRVIERFAISTAARGTGFNEGSYQTPTGNFMIREMIGDGLDRNTIFVARKPAGSWNPGTPDEGDLILARILRLEGLDPENANTWDRYIYIHGTNHENHLGEAASM